MTPEEFERVKEAEKEHLRALRKLKDAVRHFERVNKVTKAVGDMAEGASQTLETSDSMIEKLAMETARNEARLDMALAETKMSPERVKDVTPMPAAGSPPDDELQRARARDLVRRLKAQIAAGGSELEKPSTNVDEVRSETSRPEPADDTGDAEPDLPQKTIGRMR